MKTGTTWAMTLTIARLAANYDVKNFGNVVSIDINVAVEVTRAMKVT